MEKIATIDVYLDPEGEGSSASNFDPTARHGNVLLRPTNLVNPLRSKSDLADVFAHELGHLIGRVLELPDQVNALDDLIDMNFFGTPVTPAIYHSEKHAWDLAAKMRPINPRVRDPRLKGYREGMK